MESRTREIMKRGQSDSILQTPTAPKHALKASSFSKSSNSVSSPMSVINSEFYAPSRQKRVTFAAEVFQKAVPAPQRLQKLGINDVDFGGNFAKAAFTSEISPPTQPQPRTRSKRNKSVRYLESRVHKIAAQLLEASFEVEVSQNELNELELENAELKRQINERENINLGYEKLRFSVLEMKQRSRKYSSKISVLRKAITFFDEQSKALTEQLLQSKATILQYSKDHQLVLPESSTISPSAA